MYSEMNFQPTVISDGRGGGSHSFLGGVCGVTIEDQRQGLCSPYGSDERWIACGRVCGCHRGKRLVISSDSVSVGVGVRIVVICV